MNQISFDARIRGSTRLPLRKQVGIEWAQWGTYPGYPKATYTSELGGMGRTPTLVLCSRNARPEKDEKGVARCPSCSQNAHDRNVLVRCAQ
jgi:hypothetical protein